MLVRLKLRFWIGSELLRFDKPASKGAFRPLSSMCSWSNMSPSSPVLSNILREYTVYTQLCCSPQARSCMQNQRKCSLLRNLEKRIDIWTVFHSVAGPSHFIQHQQITNNLFYGFMSTGNISCAEPTLRSRCLQWKGLSVALFRKLSVYVHTVLQSGFSNSRTDVSLNSCWTQQVLRPVRSSWCW